MVLSVVDLVLKNGKVVTPYGIFEAGIGVDEGKIVVISRGANLPKADVVIDVRGNFILPGAIDAHTHLREPGRTEREDFESGTKAAAAGGITTVFEMPLSVPCVSSAEILKKRKNIVKKRAIVDFALYGGAGMHNIDKIQGLAFAGAIGFKSFLHGPPKGRDIEFEGAYVTNDGSFFEILETVARTGLTYSIHAENNAIINFLTQKLMRLGRKDAMAHPESRPNFVEAEAISKIIILAKATGAHIHIAHMSTSEGLSLIKQAKAFGQMVTAETCPHYLTLSVKAMKKLGPYVKINPPLRSERDVKELWGGLNNGIIDIVASDHAPYTKEEKDSGWDNIWNTQSGSPQIETMLPLLLNKVNEGMMSIETLTKVTSERVAKIFGVYPQKGAILIGSDADLVTVDMKLTMTVNREKMYSKAGDLSPYHGWKLKGWPIMTVVRGEVVMRDREVVGKPGYGEFVSPLKS